MSGGILISLRISTHLPRSYRLLRNRDTIVRGKITLSCMPSATTACLMSVFRRKTMLLPIACLLAAFQHVEAMPFRSSFSALDLREKWPSYDAEANAMYTFDHRQHALASPLVIAQPPIIDETPAWRRWFGTPSVRAPVAKRYNVWRSVGGPLPTNLRRIMSGPYRKPSVPTTVETPPQSHSRAMRYG
ncbi:hypothetical protein LSAT2_015488 [Lamellibrachia satsuma]|nr:hypothetical protein LSAT2_015488 [Lamellibrachia satsuma]